VIAPVSQIEAVVRATEAAGGIATLAHLYHHARLVEGSNWSGTQNPFANIRRIVQTSGRFWRVRPGLWALNSHEEQLRTELELPLDAAPAFVDEWDHGYYQGLLLEIGVLNRCNHGSSADKNRRFIQTPLKQLASLEHPPTLRSSISCDSRKPSTSVGITRADFRIRFSRSNIRRTSKIRCSNSSNFKICELGS
jgi:hypothetical protein